MAADNDRHAWERRGTFEVAPGVHRIPLPLPGDGLRAVNVYAIEQPDGVVLVDAGWSRKEAHTDLEDGLAALDRDLSMVQRVVVTHLHRDHYEMGTWLKREFGSHLSLGAGEQTTMRTIIDDGLQRQPPIVGRMHDLGAGELGEALLAAMGGTYDEAHHLGRWTLPDHWLADDEVVELAGRRLRVVATPGHTRGHVVFVDDEAGLLFAGDHVLPHITPSIGFEGVFSDTALADYLASLVLVQAMPELRLLPAHGPVRPTTHDRVDELLVHHDERLRQTRAAAREGRMTAYEVAQGLVWTSRGRSFDDLDLFNRCLATNETAAHLDVLAQRDEVAVVEESVDGRTVRAYLV